MTTTTTYCSCEEPIMDVEVDAGCRRCGLPVDFSPKPIAIERRYHVPWSQVHPGSRGAQRGKTHLHTVDGFTFERLSRKPGAALCGRRGWYEREPEGDREQTEICPGCLEIASRLERAGILAEPLTGTVEAVIVCRVAVASLSDAERLIDVWLGGAENDDRLISYIVTDRASLAQEGASA